MARSRPSRASVRLPSVRRPAAANGKPAAVNENVEVERAATAGVATPDYSALKAAGFDDLYRFTCKRCLVSNSVTFSAVDDLAVVRAAIIEAMGGRCVPVGNVPVQEL